MPNSVEPLLLLDEFAAGEALNFTRALLQAELGLGPQPALPESEGLSIKAGAFVTLLKAGHLRGCMGHVEGDLPLHQVLARVALMAAFDDPRFPELRPDEWPQVELELSLLEPLQPCPDPHGIVVGRHGILLEHEGHSALFLPQVAVEQGWELEETLYHLCRKAGLAADAWRDPDCRFFTFRAQVIPQRKA